ncbi:hypothetical protein GCM10023196_036670 [Actinoallomurus vinaceus]|uniref:2OG-Fe(II) oxygenase n=1 Tax=Actinoallomurus vinaceus TaxID=1080074 RepID=A0ABP8UBZ0_9ACTN
MTSTSAMAMTLWPTPVYEADLNGLGAGQMNPQLRDLILQAEAKANHTFGVISAAKTATDLLTWQHPAVDWLKARIRDAIDAMNRDVLEHVADLNTHPVKAEAWAVVYRAGGSHREHTHHDSVYSGVYYVQTGGVGEQGGGRLQLLDPRPAAIARSASSGVTTIRPRPGMMVAFPSWLPHSVQATLPTETAPRICIAWNAGYPEESAA